MLQVINKKLSQMQIILLDNETMRETKLKIIR